MEQLTSQDSRSYSLYFDLKIWFRVPNVTGTSRNGPQAPVAQKMDSAVHQAPVVQIG